MKEVTISLGQGVLWRITKVNDGEFIVELGASATDIVDKAAQGAWATLNWGDNEALQFNKMGKRSAEDIKRSTETNAKLQKFNGYPW